MFVKMHMADCSCENVEQENKGENSCVLGLVIADEIPYNRASTFAKMRE